MMRYRVPQKGLDERVSKYAGYNDTRLIVALKYIQYGFGYINQIPTYPIFYLLKGDYKIAPRYFKSPLLLANPCNALAQVPYVVPG